MPESDLLTDRLRLRLMDARDAALYRALYTDARVMAAIGPPLLPEVADSAFERVLAHNVREAPGHRHWAVALHGFAPAGLTALIRHGRAAEWGLMLQPWMQGMGLAGEVLEALIPVAFTAPDIDGMRACTQGGLHGERMSRLLEPRGFAVDPSAPDGAQWWRLDRPQQHDALIGNGPTPG